MPQMIDRRQMLRAGTSAAGALALNALLPAWARSATKGLAPMLPALSGADIALHVGHSPITIDGRKAHAITVNGTVPAPLIRLRAGQQVRLAVANHLDEDTSLHWHGLLESGQASCRERGCQYG